MGRRQGSTLDPVVPRPDSRVEVEVESVVLGGSVGVK